MENIDAWAAGSTPVGRGALGDSACVTAVTDSSADDVLSAFGVGATTAPVPLSAVDSDEPAVGVVSVGAGFLAVEWSSIAGVHAEVLMALSSRGRAASVYWTINMASEVSFAENGQLLRSFHDVLLSRGGGVDPADIDPLLAGLELDDDPIVLLVRSVERFTGVAITAAAITSIHEVYPITPVLGDLNVEQRDATPRDERWFVRAASEIKGVGDPELPNLIVAATPARQREFARWAADQALARAELLDTPAVVEAREQLLRGDIGPMPAAAAELARKLQAASFRANARDSGLLEPQTRRATIQAHAMNALRAAAEVLDPDDAAIQAAKVARHVFWDRKGEWRRATRAYFEISP